MYSKHAIGAVALFLMIGTTASSARTAVSQDCQTVTGKGQWTLIPSGDPLGRVLGPTTGNLKASVSASLTSLAPNPNGSLSATSDDDFSECVRKRRRLIMIPSA